MSRAIGLVCLAVVLITTPLAAGGLKKGFVYLRDVDPSILQDMRYATANNFVGRPLPGYNAAECILVEAAAQALKDVQAELREQRQSLKIFDCYRPARAVREFVRWAKMPEDPAVRTAYHPRIAKPELFPTYIATRSSHSRGAAVDLTIVDLTQKTASPGKRSCRPARWHEEKRPGAELDMGTDFDCFDAASNTAVAGLSELQRNNRMYLRNIMAHHGLRNYSREWWHFTYTLEPFPHSYFDFAIESREPLETSVGIQK